MRTTHLFIFQLLGIYGSTLMGQNEDGNNLYRGIEARFTLYLAHYKINLDTFLEAPPHLKKAINEFVFNSRNKA